MQLNLNPEKTYYVAYSGGIDSLALCLLLQQQGYSFKAVHINHKTEKYKEFDDACATAIRSLYEHLAIEVQIIDAPVKSKIVKSHGLETAMRQVRYDALIRHVYLDPVGVILTGHHGDDQIETILIQMFRGTGVSGLTGIDEASYITTTDGSLTVEMQRPLLQFRKTELINVVESNNALCHVIDDPSNLDMDVTRSRVRHNVIPAIRDAFGEAQMHTAIQRMVANMKDAESLLDTSGADQFHSMKGWVDIKSTDTTVWISHEFVALENLRKKNLIRYMAKLAKMRLTSGHIDEILKQSKVNREGVPQNCCVKISNIGEFIIDTRKKTRHHDYFICLRHIH